MKLFSDSYLNNYEILKNALIGFELELYSKHNYPITLEILNRELSPIKVWGFKQYHSKFKPDENNFKLEPDQSGGGNMAELVTGPMKYTNARIILTKILSIMQKIGHTTDRCGIHINISFPNGKNIERLNILKMILNIDEEKIYQLFPDRQENVYAQSVKNIIPFKGYDYTNASTSVLSNSLMLPQSKYYGINFSTLTNGRLEFRYLGGENYQSKISHILDMMDYFCLLSWNCIDSNLNDSEAKKLRSYLDYNIRKYKSLTKLENFISQFPHVELQIDKRRDYEVVNAYYDLLYDDIYDIITYSKNLSGIIINYDTETKAIEIVGGDNIELIGSIENFDFISCNIIGGELNNCQIINCTLENNILNNCKISDTEVKDGKLTACNVDEYSELKDSFFTHGYLNGKMFGGVFRSGKVGKDGYISDETKVLSDDENFFNIKLSDDEVTQGKLGKLNKK